MTQPFNDWPDSLKQAYVDAVRDPLYERIGLIVSIPHTYDQANTERTRIMELQNDPRATEEDLLFLMAGTRDPDLRRSIGLKIIQRDPTLSQLRYALVFYPQGGPEGSNLIARTMLQRHDLTPDDYCSIIAHADAGVAKIAWDKLVSSDPPRITWLHLLLTPINNQEYRIKSANILMGNSPSEEERALISQFLPNL